MAQAARLNLRMHKELKLLLTDPPPGASFPSLSDSSSSSSLTSIDALFQGPEGSVYASGVFKMKIQIPERYPFQPPVVNFATPIYHPNIDNGGRICLDILNLPPKGTWQPSLNISTVLTSIGLLLSEPNPDDGLMHEASSEYKYNRQAFNQNARLMTEKYAIARGESADTEGRHGNCSHSCPSTEDDVEGSNESMYVPEHFVCHERSSGSNGRLSLEFLGSCSNSGGNVSEAPVHGCLMNDTDIWQPREASSIYDEHAANPGKLQATRNKLSLGTSVVSHGQNGKASISDLPSQCSSRLKNQILRTDSRTVSPSVRLIPASGVLSSSQQHLENEKENLHPVGCLPPQLRDQSAACQRAEKQVVVQGLKQSEMSKEVLPKHGGEVIGRESDNPIVLNNGNESAPRPELLHMRNDIRSGYDFDEEFSDKVKQCSENTMKPEATIVLDSEDSEDDNPPLRSKLSLAKRCLTRKRKSCF